MMQPELCTTVNQPMRPYGLQWLAEPEPVVETARGHASGSRPRKCKRLRYGLEEKSIGLVPAPLLVFRQDGTLAHANTSAAALLGWQGNTCWQRYVTMLDTSARMPFRDALRFALRTRREMTVRHAVQISVRCRAMWTLRMKGAVLGRRQYVLAAIENVLPCYGCGEVPTAHKQLANVAHDLRTRLQMVLAEVELLSLGGVRAQARQHVHGLRTQGHLMQELLSNVLDDAQLREGRMRVFMARHDLRSLTAEIEQYAAMVKSSGISLICLKPEAPCLVYCDLEKIRRVVLNLLSNAVKYMDVGGVITVTMQPSQAQGTVELTVSDTGCGIAPERLPSLFTRFAQHTPSVNGMVGSGLGLSLVKEMTEMMGGTVSVESALGEGTMFRLVFPMARDGE